MAKTMMELVNVDAKVAVAYKIIQDATLSGNQDQLLSSMPKLKEASDAMEQASKLHQELAKKNNYTMKSF